MNIPIAQLAEEVRKLLLKEEVKKKWLHDNAVKFLKIK